jgi:hypothetical protein
MDTNRVQTGLAGLVDNPGAGLLIYLIALPHYEWCTRVSAPQVALRFHRVDGRASGNGLGTLLQPGIWPRVGLCLFDFNY